MAINKNKVVTFNDLENYAGISTGSNLTIPSTWNLVTGLNSTWFKGFLITDSSVKPNDYLKYLYYGYCPCANVHLAGIEIDINFLYVGNNQWDGSVPMYHIDNYNTTIYNEYITSSDSQEFVELILPIIRGDSVPTSNIAIIQYSSIASLADDDMVNDIWTSYHSIIDPSTGEPMKDENGNILYEEGEYYAETRKIGDPISL